MTLHSTNSGGQTAPRDEAIDAIARALWEDQTGVVYDVEPAPTATWNRLIVNAQTAMNVLHKLGWVKA